jgi:hypothetical protein
LTEEQAPVAAMNSTPRIDGQRMVRSLGVGM